MRYALASLLFALSATLAHAQQSTPPPSVGLPLPPIGLPLPVIGLQPNEPPLSVAPISPKRDRPPHPSRPAIVVFGAPPVWGFDAWQLSPVPGVIAHAPAVETTPVALMPAPEESGHLRLELKPEHAQLFVDGEFVGTWADVGGELELRTGTRRIEVRAPGFEALAIDVRIAAGRSITYRGSLTRLEDTRRPSSPAPASPRTLPDAPAAPKSAEQKFYLIPGCYLGNVPPDQVKLPAGCDLSRMITHVPAR